MKALNVVTLVLLVLGGLNWGLIGLLQLDLVALVFGGADSPLSRMVDLFVGSAALWQLLRWMRVRRRLQPASATTG
ncbi:DUF378 domain-containing protein [Lysobacter sp. TY2-98]|uniref:DUF378 domain-containing protein n=1 Tax=Lysobacter sp. TY2-98 TaxID=2290922 RepID=UPI000E206B82|nr:DUF378 domain-containing protein [Lysobacter sp. TY2-98]AXK73325.1 DUF378 domain-containing protein [Lysobacter sp. TY2-98]